MNQNFKEFIINFIMGGGLIAGCGLISQIYSSSLSGMVYSSLPLGMIYLHVYIFLKDGRAESSKYALFSIIGGVLWVAIAYLIYKFNYLPLYINALLSTSLYIIFAVITFSFFDKKINVKKNLNIQNIEKFSLICLND